MTKFTLASFRRGLGILALTLLPALVLGQDIIPPAGGGVGSSGGLADPGAGGVVVRTVLDTTVARSVIATDGSIIVSNGDGQSGDIDIGVDSSVIPFYSTGTGDPAATCTFGEFYIETDTLEVYKCVSEDPDTWQLLGNVAGTPTDDFVLVGSGSAWEIKAVPDCDDSSGNHLNYDTATNTFSCGTSSSGGASTPDYSATLDIYEDFVGGTTAASLTMLAGGINSGTSALDPGTSANNPGVLKLNAHSTNDNSGVSVVWSTNSIWDDSLWLGTDWALDGVVYFGSTGDITNNGFWFGLANSFNGIASASRGIFIRRDTDASDTAFVFQICNANSAAGCQAAGDDTNSSTVTSTVTPSDNTAYRFRIRRAASGVGGNPTIYFRVNNETEKTFCASGCDDTLGTLPADTIVFGLSSITRAASNPSTSELDYLHLHMTGISRY